MGRLDGMRGGLGGLRLGGMRDCVGLDKWIVDWMGQGIGWVEIGWDGRLGGMREGIGRVEIGWDGRLGGMGERIGLVEIGWDGRLGGMGEGIG